MIASDRYSLIVGMGATGLSIAHFLRDNGRRFCAYDTRDQASLAIEFERCFDELACYFKVIPEDVVAGADRLLLSPGVSRDEPVVQQALSLGIPVVGDIELFLSVVDKPVIGITGSNGKSTVTTLVSQAAENAGLKVGVGGNIGTPALALLNEPADIYVLELSSFQLESTTRPNLTVACMLNVTPDHMDRYANIGEYVAAKQRIFYGAKNVIYALDDVLTRPPVARDIKRFGFGLSSHPEVEELQYYLDVNSGYLCCTGRQIVHVDAIKMKGKHNLFNALALLAIAEAAGIGEQACLKALASFTGLPHRCQWIAEHSGVTFINDSKATNIGAAQAAICGLGSEYSAITLIAGGDGKGADFLGLARTINQLVGTLVLIGCDADKIEKHIDNKRVHVIHADDMRVAVREATRVSAPGGLVLLAPACASFDMFSGFEERGEQFIQAVEEVGCDATIL